MLGIFGITGDLATRMTLPSLYRLERRGLLGCPVVGVAGDDWTAERLRDHARDAVEATGETVDEAVFGRLAGRLSYVQGDFADGATYGRVAAALDGCRAPVFSLEGPPSAGPGRRPRGVTRRLARPLGAVMIAATTAGRPSETP